jgi:hypothetical protein
MDEVSVERGTFSYISLCTEENEAAFFNVLFPVSFVFSIRVPYPLHLR